MRRGGFATRRDAESALGKVLEYERSGLHVDDRETVAEYLRRWLQVKALELKPTTMAGYEDYVAKDLVPALGALRLEELSHRHIALYIRDQLGRDRGATTLRRCVATLSSALGDAVRQHRLSHNPARYATVPRSPKYEPVCWTPAEAARFLRYCADQGDRLTNLFEVLVGTGLRKGEALALHWEDVNLDDGVLLVRHTLSNINNTTPVFTAPKTKSSHAWVCLSPRVTAAFRDQATRQPGRDLVFTRENGQPLRPEYVLRHFHALTAETGLPRIRVHDLRHFAATTMISANVPLAMVSKTLRHSTVSTTTQVYTHLLLPAAQQAVGAIADALDNAGQESGDHTATTNP
ncbi:site-specific recombinase XerD [Actinokineospora spheciospongiae]|nr:site-specific recombinase XerD [Actinokineospora spheciospongiae]